MLIDIYCIENTSKNFHCNLCDNDGKAYGSFLLAIGKPGL